MTEAQDTLAALDLLEATQVGAVVLDLDHLLGLSGLWLLDELDDPPPTLVLSMRGYSYEVLRRAQKFYAYLQKPIDAPTLLAAVHRAIAYGRGA